jgi:hypothetical protein
MSIRAAMSRFPVPLLIVLLAVFGSPAVAASSSSGAHPLGCADAWKKMSPPSPADGGQATFYDVDGTGRGDVWAVGRSDGGSWVHALIDHWDGHAWTEFAVADAGDSAALHSVAVLSPTDAWAVGWDFDPHTGRYRGLAEHWDGVAWSGVAVPAPGNEVFLYGVAAASAARVIAVGQFSKERVTRTLAIRLRDGAWHTMVTLSADPYSFLQGVAMNGRSDAWAVGGSTGPGGPHVLALHWDGHVWSDTGAPDPGVYRNLMLGVDAIAPDDVWAVGSSENADATRWWSAWHWDGTSWTAYEAGEPGTAMDLQAVSHLAPDDVRMVGNLPIGTSPMRAAHWDGTELSVDTVPALAPNREGHLYGSAVIAGQLWAAGAVSNSHSHQTVRGLIARRCPAA